MRIPGVSYANVTATVALIAALGGTSYAAVSISGADVRNGSLSGADIRNSSLTGSDVKGGSLSGSDIKNGSLLAGDFKAGQLPAGAAGPAGPAGPQGETGPAGATKVVARRTDLLVPAGAQRAAIAECESGEVAVGGGSGITGSLANVSGIASDDPREADGSLPEDGEPATAWRAVGLNFSGVAQLMNVHVLCASP